MTTAVDKAAKLDALNAFRVADGKTAYADWRQARHQPMLDEYCAARNKARDEANAKREAEIAAKQAALDAGKTIENGEVVKLPAYKVLANKSGKKSSLDNPVKFIHDWLNENPDVKRKQAVTTLVGFGVNYSTARTQYQRWFSGRK